MNAIEAHGVTVRLGGREVVRNVDVVVPGGQWMGLIGPNGAGKTTAFNLLSGQFPLDAGHVTLDGHRVDGLEPHAITRAGLGRSFQITNLFGGLSVEENIRLAVQARHPSRFNPFRDARAIPEINADTAELLRWTGLAGVERAEAASLSYGGQRLLDIDARIRRQDDVHTASTGEDVRPHDGAQLGQQHGERRGTVGRQVAGPDRLD